MSEYPDVVAEEESNVVIEIDRERCMGSGNCAFHAPNTFDLDDEMKVVVVDTAGDPPEKIRLAVEGCPTLALVLR